MSALETELELESLEFENLGEAEAEQEAFFNHLAAMADRGGRSQALRRVAMAAAREALRGARRPWPVIEGEFEFELEGEGGFELEGSFELEAFLNPAQRGAALAMMEHMAHEAAHAENEQEAAEQFLPLIPLAAKALLPLAAKALPIVGKIGAKVGGKLLSKAAPKLLGRVVPNLTRGVSQLARGLFRNRSTRPLLRAVPTIARRTVGRLASQALRGRRITPVGAARTLARQTLRTLRSPRDLSRTYRRARGADRRYHRRARRYIGAPARGGARAISGRPPLSSYGAGAGAASPGVTPVAPLTPIAPVVNVPMAMGVPAGAALAPCQCFRSVPCPSCGA